MSGRSPLTCPSKPSVVRLLPSLRLCCYILASLCGWFAAFMYTQKEIIEHDAVINAHYGQHYDIATKLAQSIHDFSMVYVPSLTALWI